MLKDIIARRYAKALLSLAAKSGETDAVKKDLASMAELYRASKQLQSVIMNPIFSLKDKNAVVNGLAKELKVSPLSERFLDMIARKRRFRYIREVAASYSDLLDLAQGKVKATVTAADTLPEATVAKLGALANAEIEPTGGKEVERGRLLCEQNRIVPWRHDDSGAQPQCRRAHCQGRKQHQRGGKLVPTAEMMLHRKARMKPERLCLNIEIKKFEKAAASLRSEACNIGFRRTEQTEPHF